MQDADDDREFEELAAVTGALDWPAIILFGIIFLWTPPHFWSLAVRYEGDYARAGVPMLPVVSGLKETSRQIFLYTLVLVACTLLLTPAASMGLFYTAAAIALGAGFVWLAARLWRGGTLQTSRRLFFFSIAYLALLFGAVGVDVFLT